jgi:hypothetical protein
MKNINEKIDKHFGLNFNLYWILSEKWSTFEIKNESWSILIRRKDILKLWINRKTLNTFIKRHSDQIKMYKYNEYELIDLKLILYYLTIHNNRK